MNEAKESQLIHAFHEFISEYARSAFVDDKDLKGKNLSSFNVKTSDYHTVVVQLRALGLITESQKKRSIKDTDTYWQLTPHGDQLMVQLRALHRDAPERKASGQKTDDVEND